MKISQGFVINKIVQVTSYRMYTKVGNEARGIDMYEESLWFWSIHCILLGYPLAKLVYGNFERRGFV